MEYVIASSFCKPTENVLRYYRILESVKFLVIILIQYVPITIAHVKKRFLEFLKWGAWMAQSVKGLTEGFGSRPDLGS